LGNEYNPGTYVYKLTKMKHALDKCEYPNKIRITGPWEGKPTESPFIKHSEVIVEHPFFPKNKTIDSG